MDEELLFDEFDLSLPEPFYRRALPHFQPHDAPYFVTYRLEGSVPNSEMARMRELHRAAGTHREHAVFFREFDRILDANGPYSLAEPAIRKIIMDSLDYLNGREIYIYAYTVMPNHVHAVFTVLDRTLPLFRILQHHKRHTARQSNIVLATTGAAFWRPETYDRVVREGTLGNIIWYILLNPVKAGLAKHWREWPGTYLSPDCYGFD